MAIASSQQTKWGLIAETVFGQTPATPQLLEQRQSDTNFTLEIETVLDESKTGLRQYLDSTQGNRTVTGSLSGPFAHNSYDALLETAMFNKWAGNSLVLGNDRQSVTLEENVGNGVFFQYNGVLGNQLTIDAPNNGTVTFSLEVMALEEKSTSASISTAEYTPYAARTPFSHCRGTVTEGGVPIAYVSAINMSLNNNITIQQYWGDCDTGDLTDGRAEVSGTLTVFFVSDVLYNKFVSGVASSLSFTLDDGTNTMTFDMPKIKYSSGEKGSGNNSDPRTVTLGFNAYAPSTTGSALTITRSA